LLLGGEYEGEGVFWWQGHGIRIANFFLKNEMLLFLWIFSVLVFARLAVPRERHCIHPKKEHNPDAKK
jgi:hypothetical protein